MTGRARLGAQSLAAGSLALVGTAAGSAAAAVVLHHLGSGRLSTPPIHAWAALAQWYEATPPQLALIAMLRCAALALAGWLCIASTLQILGALRAFRTLRRLADAISPRSLQRFGHGLAGLSLTAGLAAVAPSAGILATTEGRSATVLAFDDDPSMSSDTGEPRTATLRVLGDDEPVPAPKADDDEVTVAVGDSLWSIAVNVLTERVGAPPTDRQVIPYWRRLIEANRTRLVDPTNADLIFPGQVFTLPPG